MHLLHSFYDFNYVLKQPIHLITKLLKKADEKELERFAWEKWLVDYANRGDQHFPSFKEYLEKIKKPTVEQTFESVEETFNKLKNKVKKPS